MLNKIWPWSKLEERRDLIVKLDTQCKALEYDRDNYRARSWELEARVKELKSERDRYLKQIEDYTREAKADVRSGYIMRDKQQATDIKFRSVKVDLQCMKKINKQASVAIRYVAQHVKSNALQSDLRAIADIIHPDTFNEMGIEHMRSADMVEDTRQMQELIAKSNGKVAD